MPGERRGAIRPHVLDDGRELRVVADLVLLQLRQLLLVDASERRLHRVGIIRRRQVLPGGHVLHEVLQLLGVRRLHAHLARKVLHDAVELRVLHELRRHVHELRVVHHGHHGAHVEAARATGAEAGEACEGVGTLLLELLLRRAQVLLVPLVLGVEVERLAVRVNSALEVVVVEVRRAKTGEGLRVSRVERNRLLAVGHSRLVVLEVDVGGGAVGVVEVVRGLELHRLGVVAKGVLVLALRHQFVALRLELLRRHALVGVLTGAELGLGLLEARVVLRGALLDAVEVPALLHNEKELLELGIVLGRGRVAALAVRLPHSDEVLRGCGVALDAEARGEALRGDLHALDVLELERLEHLQERRADGAVGLVNFDRHFRFFKIGNKVQKL
eukprot:PhM_4_TR7936/c1_g2_i1/m.97611